MCVEVLFVFRLADKPLVMVLKFGNRRCQQHRYHQDRTNSSESVQHRQKLPQYEPHYFSLHGSGTVKSTGCATFSLSRAMESTSEISFT